MTVTFLCNGVISQLQRCKNILLELGDTIVGISATRTGADRNQLQMLVLINQHACPYVISDFVNDL